MSDGRKYVGQTRRTMMQRWPVSVRPRDPRRGFNLRAGGNAAPALFAPGALAKMSEASKLAQTPESRARSSVRVKAVWQDPVKRESRVAAMTAAVRASEPSRDRAAAGEKLKVRYAADRAARTHFACSVHGPVLLADCYSKVGPRGFRQYECKACVLAAQKVKRDAFRAANPLVPKTTYRCKVHGEVPHAECYRRKGTNAYRCKRCTNAKNIAEAAQRKR